MSAGYFGFLATSLMHLTSHWLWKRMQTFWHSFTPASHLCTDRICDEISPFCRLENDAFDEDGNSLSDMGFDSDQIAIRSPPSLNDDAYTLYYPPEKRWVRVSQCAELHFHFLKDFLAVCDNVCFLCFPQSFSCYLSSVIFTPSSLNVDNHDK